MLVTGATGNTGSALIPLLQERGVAVRAMVRDEQSRSNLGRSSSSIVIGNFDDSDSIRAALDGAESAYLVTPSSAEAEAQQIRFAELATAAGVRQLVKLSQLGADETSPGSLSALSRGGRTANSEAWDRLYVSAPKPLFSRPPRFRLDHCESGTILCSHRPAPVSAVDVRDIAAVAAAALTEQGHLGKVYTITGPAASTHADVAPAIAAAMCTSLMFPRKTLPLPWESSECPHGRWPV